MFDEKPPELFPPTVADVWQSGPQLERPVESVERANPVKMRAFRVKMGREPIWLRTIEYRILTFLSARPYRAFSRRRIARAVSTARHPLDEEAVDHYVACLRDQLGFFRNYVQTVPYVGYRFKA